MAPLFYRQVHFYILHFIRKYKNGSSAMNIALNFDI